MPRAVSRDPVGPRHVFGAFSAEDEQRATSLEIVGASDVYRMNGDAVIWVRSVAPRYVLGNE